MSRRKTRTNRTPAAHPAPSPARRTDQDSAGQPTSAVTAAQTPPTNMPGEPGGKAQTPPQAPAGEPEAVAPGPGPTPPLPDVYKAVQETAQGTPTGEDEGQEQRHGPIWSASEASRRCGIGRATMTRKLQAGLIAGATRDEDGHWQVPLSGLLAAGLHPDRPAPPEDDQDDETKDEDIAAAVELAELRGQLTVEKARREAAEQLAAERSARIEDLRHALRALEPPAPAQEAAHQGEQPVQAAPPTSQTEPPAQPEGVAGRLRRWWRGQ